MIIILKPSRCTVCGDGPVLGTAPAHVVGWMCGCMKCEKVALAKTAAEVIAKWEELNKLPKVSSSLECDISEAMK